MKMYIASDHAGFQLKEKILTYFKNEIEDIMIVDLGTNDEASCHYPLYAKSLCEKVAINPNNQGILICGTGIGMSIAANKFQNIRAAVCKSEEEGKLAKIHNHANVLCLGARSLNDEENFKILQAFLKAEYGGNRHEQRVHLMEKWGEKLT